MPTCFLNGLCGKSAPQKIKMPIQDPVLAPFVEVQIRSASQAIIAQASGLAPFYGANPVDISVGNQSFPAAVKSLVVGASNGMGADIEIVDQEGGDFAQIFQKISRVGTASVDQILWLRWGWIATECGGGFIPASSGGESDPSQQPTAGGSTDFLSYIIQNVSVDYSAGVIKYTIRCTDLFAKLIDVKVPGVIGPKFLTEAIQDLCNEVGVMPKFVAYSDAGTETDFKWKTDGSGNIDEDNGPYGKWEGKNRNVLACFMEWIRPYLVDTGSTQGRGITLLTDSSTQTGGKNGTLVFQSSISPTLGDTSSFNASNFLIASYLVNSGNCSPVISFRPVIQFTHVNAYTTGGTGGAAASGGTTPNMGPTQLGGNSSLSPEFYNNVWKVSRAGFNVAMTITRDERLGRIKKAAQYAYNAMYQHGLANCLSNPIKAELKVQGDPTLSSPLLFLHRYVNLTVINPFGIEDSAPCEWGNSVEPCNQILSSGSWIIEGVSHDIRDGSYTTTLKLSLPSPGTEIPYSSD